MIIDDSEFGQQRREWTAELDRYIDRPFDDSKGGPGSGNFGHGGRPGEVGGASSEGGVAAEQPSNPRAARAISTYKPSTKEKQDQGDTNQREVAKRLGADVSDDNRPLDVTLKIGRKTVGIEVKTFCDQGSDKVTMHPDSLQRKTEWGKKEAAVLFTVVIDDRKTFSGGAHADKYSGSRIYVARGVGSYRLGSMTPMKTWKQAAEFIRGNV